MLGKDLHKQVQAYLNELGRIGSVVNATIAMASAKRIVRKKDSRLLAENGGNVVFTKDCSHYLLLQMRYVNRKGNSKVKVTMSNFEELKANFLSDVKAVVLMEEIPPPLILNCDHTGLKYVPLSSWKMAKEGAKKMSIAGIEDKCQITGVFAITLDGKFFPPQLIY